MTDDKKWREGITHTPNSLLQDIDEQVWLKTALAARLISERSVWIWKTEFERFYHERIKKHPEERDESARKYLRAGRARKVLTAIEYYSYKDKYPTNTQQHYKIDMLNQDVYKKSLTDIFYKEEVATRVDDTDLKNIKLYNQVEYEVGKVVDSALHLGLIKHVPAQEKIRGNEKPLRATQPLSDLLRSYGLEVARIIVDA